MPKRVKTASKRIARFNKKTPLAFFRRFSPQSLLLLIVLIVGLSAAIVVNAQTILRPNASDTGCPNGVAIGQTACNAQGDPHQFRCQPGSTIDDPKWSQESCNGGACIDRSCTSGSGGGGDQSGGGFICSSTWPTSKGCLGVAESTKVGITDPRYPSGYCVCQRVIPGSVHCGCVPPENQDEDGGSQDLSGANIPTDCSSSPSVCGTNRYCKNENGKKICRPKIDNGFRCDLSKDTAVSLNDTCKSGNCPLAPKRARTCQPKKDKSCGSDPECVSKFGKNYFCDANIKQCLLKRVDNASCTRPEDCSSEVCLNRKCVTSCKNAAGIKDHSLCGSRGFCGDDGKCYSRKGIYDSCNLNEIRECGAGLKCINSICSIPDNRVSFGCVENGYDTSNKNGKCAPNQFCALNGLCYTKKSKDNYCQADAECRDGLKCIKSLCQNPDSANKDAENCMRDGRIVHTLCGPHLYCKQVGSQAICKARLDLNEECGGDHRKCKNKMLCLPDHSNVYRCRYPN